MLLCENRRSFNPEHREAELMFHSWLVSFFLDGQPLWGWDLFVAPTPG
jgi:hypothetical protein